MKHFHLPSVVLAGLLASASSGRANEIVDSFRVADGYAVKNAVKEGLVANPGFAGFDDLGRLFVTESIAGDTADERRGRIRILEDTDGTGGFDSSLVFAADLPELGGVLSLGANTYATTPTGLIRFSDTDRDGIADKQETLLTGWTARGSERLHGPFRGPDGWLYLTQGRAGFEIKTSEGFGFEGRAARVWRFRPDGTGLAVIAGGGFSNPGELVFTSSGEVIGTVSYVTEPAYGERDGLVHFVEGGVYGLNGPVVQEFKTTGDLLGALSSLASVSPAGLLRYEGTQFGVDAVGHLFSAQTEAGRIQRHQLTRTNATYTSDDSDFLVSANGGFQPRDVVETPTGSLLVIDGGTIGSSAGGLYEVSLIGAVPPDEKNRGRRAIRNLISQLSRARSSEERNDALWQIHRAGGKKSQETIRAAFDDRSVDVRIAAVMSAGLSGDVDALDQLHEMIAAEKDASVRRAIATALGRIGEVKSNGRLIRAAGREIPRFEEHAIIHSLNRVYGRMTNSSFKYTAPQIGRLPSGSARAALIAFEQMTPNPLRPEHILPLFDISNGDMQRAAGWVFNRHPEWITNIVGHLHKKLLQYSLNEAELASMKELFEEFSGTRVMQDLMADAYSNVRLEEDRRKMLIDVMRNAEVSPISGKWIGALKLALISEDDFTRTAAFEMIERHNLAGFEDFIAQTAEVDKRDDIRFRAFTLLAKWGELSGEQIGYLFDQLEPDAQVSPTRRLGAARALSQAKLPAKDLSRIVTEFIPKADIATLPILLESFRGRTNATIGQNLIESLLDNQKLWPNIRPRLLPAVLKGFPEKVQVEAQILIGKVAAAHQSSLAGLRSFSHLLEGGEAGNGRRVFFSEVARCASCHRVGALGNAIGPDLSRIGRVRGGLDLLEAIVQPDTRLVPGFETYRVRTKSGAVNGILVEESATAVALQVNATRVMRLPTAAIESFDSVPASIMPSGLHEGLTENQLRDLLAFLRSLRGG